MKDITSRSVPVPVCLTCHIATTHKAEKSLSSSDWQEGAWLKTGNINSLVVVLIFLNQENVSSLHADSIQPRYYCHLEFLVGNWQFQVKIFSGRDPVKKLSALRSHIHILSAGQVITDKMQDFMPISSWSGLLLLVRSLKIDFLCKKGRWPTNAINSRTGQTWNF